MAWAGIGLPRCGGRQWADAQRLDSGERLAAREFSANAVRRDDDWDPQFDTDSCSSVDRKRRVSIGEGDKHADVLPRHFRE